MYASYLSDALQSVAKFKTIGERGGDPQLSTTCKHMETNPRMWHQLSAGMHALRYISRHPVGRKQPLRTLARMVRWQARSRTSRGLIPHLWISGSKLLVSKGLTGATGDIYYGFHEFGEMAFAALYLRPGDRFADVGANVGSYSVIASAIAGASTDCFEPNDAARAILTQQVDANAIGSLVTVHACAIGERAGTVRFT